MEKNKYSGVWIPKEVLNIDTKNGNEKILLAMIFSLSDKNPCTASDKYFAELLHLSISQVNRMISKFEDKGYINKKTINASRSITISNKMYVRINADNLCANMHKPMRKYADNLYADMRINNIEDNININTSTTTKKIKDNLKFIDDVCKKKGVTKELVFKWVEEFVEYNFSIQKKWIDYSDLLKHFLSTIKDKPKEPVIIVEDLENNLKWFIDVFNSISKKDYKITETIRNRFKKQFAVGYAGNDFRVAIQNLYSSSHYNKFHIDSSFKYATPEYLLKEDNVNKYLNVSFGSKSVTRMKRIG